MSEEGSDLASAGKGKTTFVLLPKKYKDMPMKPPEAKLSSRKNALLLVTVLMPKRTP